MDEALEKARATVLYLKDRTRFSPQELAELTSSLLLIAFSRIEVLEKKIAALENKI